MQPLDREPMKVEEPRKASWKRRNLSSLTAIPPFAHFLIHTFNTHLLRAMLSIALCFFTMEMAAIALFPTMGNKMHTGRENSDKF